MVSYQQIWGAIEELHETTARQQRLANAWVVLPKPPTRLRAQHNMAVGDHACQQPFSSHPTRRGISSAFVWYI
jgi:hypothetical protein